MKHVRTLTLEQIDGVPWGDPPADATGLVATVHALRRKPLAQFDTEDLRVLLGQCVQPEFLVEMALDVLEQDPLAEGRYFPGDLLDAVLRQSADFWHRNPDHAERLDRVVTAAEAAEPSDHQFPLPKSVRDDIEAYRALRRPDEQKPR